VFRLNNDIKAVLLDLDDTILADDPASIVSWQKVCSEYAPRIGGISPDDLYQAIRRASQEYWSDPENHRRGRLNLPQTRRQVVALAFSIHNWGTSAMAYQMAEDFTAEKDRRIDFYPGALETLRTLKNQGYPLALLTNGSSEMQRSKIDRFGLESFFNCILIEGEFGVGKPDKRVFLAALECLKVSSFEACMVGDDLSRDIQGAQGVGICSIWVDYKGAGLPAESGIRPDYVIRSLSQLV